MAGNNRKTIEIALLLQEEYHIFKATNCVLTLSQIASMVGTTEEDARLRLKDLEVMGFAKRLSLGWEYIPIPSPEPSEDDNESQ